MLALAGEATLARHRLIAWRAPKRHSEARAIEKDLRVGRGTRQVTLRKCKVMFFVNKLDKGSAERQAMSLEELTITRVSLSVTVSG